ncbi:hypothetical protein AB0H49_05610 [Nocardia sp. NPDC050713]
MSTSTTAMTSKIVMARWGAGTLRVAGASEGETSSRPWSAGID